MLTDPKSIAHIVQTYFHNLKTFLINGELVLAPKKGSRAQDNCFNKKKMTGI